MKQNRSFYAQILFAALAFVIMTTLSYVFMRSIVRGNLVQTADGVLDVAEARATSRLDGFESATESFAEEVRGIIMRNGRADALQEYIDTISRFSFLDGNVVSGIQEFFGYFETLPEGPAMLYNSSRSLPKSDRENREKTTFLANMSHEIRTPLNAVIGLSELTLDNNRLGDDVEDKLEKIRASGMVILSIVNDILDISKLESGKFEIYVTQYDTPSLINDVVTFNSVRIGEKPIALKIDVSEDLPCSLCGDDLRIKQIFNNLLSNAFKYTDSGTVEWRVSFERDGDAGWLVSSVRDTGIGIRRENVQKLFSEYNQIDVNANRKVEGTGLGLAITKRFVEMMGGTITVESEYGKGTAFHVRLRQKIARATPIGRDVAHSLMEMRYALAKRDNTKRQERAKFSYARVLVVDDIMTNLDVARGMLKPYGLKVDCATSGRRAIEMIRAEKAHYDAIFMDHMMPEMDGVEAARIIHEEIGTEYARNIPIIALTANAVVGTEEMFLSMGFQDFIPKPIDTAKLDAVLRRWVRDKEREKNPSSTGGFN